MEGTVCLLAEIDISNEHGVRINVRRTIRIWQRIAFSCFILSMLMVGALIFIERIDKGRCQEELSSNSISAVAILSGFMLIFFEHISRDDFRALDNLVSKMEDLSVWIPITYLHIIFYISFFMFCAVTFAAPIMSAFIFRFTLMNCGYL
jgi:hypothetical protein